MMMMVMIIMMMMMTTAPMTTMASLYICCPTRRGCFFKRHTVLQRKIKPRTVYLKITHCSYLLLFALDYQHLSSSSSSSTSAFLACHQCRFASRLGFESSGFSMWHFLKLVARGFLRALRFPPLLHRLMVQPIK